VYALDDVISPILVKSKVGEVKKFGENVPKLVKCP
jgi:hypothetical protein